MEYPKREKGKTLIGSWASGFAAKSSFEINQAMSKCDLVYALKEGESLRSLEARIKPSKCRAFPPYVNNTEAAHEWLNHKHGPNKYTFVPPEVMFRYTGLVEEVLQKWEIHYEALKKRLPTSAANALDVLDKEVRKMDEERGRIVDEYNQACRLHQIPASQAEEELERYLKSDIPAAEFIAPVCVCRAFKTRLFELPRFEHSLWKHG